MLLEDDRGKLTVLLTGVTMSPVKTTGAPREFAPAWLLDAPSLERRVEWDGVAPMVDDVRATDAPGGSMRALPLTGMGSWLDDLGCAPTT